VTAQKPASVSSSLSVPAVALSLTLAGVLGFVACANDPVDESGDSLATPRLQTPAAPGDQGYYTVRDDGRWCAKPGCEGYFVSAVNLASTRCADGTSAPECHVTGLDLTAVGLGDEDRKNVLAAAESQDLRLIVHGTLGSELVADETWLGIAEGRAGGTFARVTSTGIVCVAAPCPSWHAAVLDTDEGHDLAGIDFEPAALSATQRDAVLTAVREKRGIIVAGKEYTVSGPAGTMPGYQANQVYLPVLPHVAVTDDPSACYVGGCSSEICSDDPEAVSTCEFRPEYECYRAATCARQPDLRCGWTPTPELRECLANPPALE
jgi:hypothetical protein